MDIDVDVDVDVEELTTVANEIANKLNHKWEDCGIGAYEFWGQKGCDVDWRPILTTTVVGVLFSSKSTVIPMEVRGHYDGYSDAPHPACRETDIDFKATLLSVCPKDQDYLVSYTIEQL